MRRELVGVTEGLADILGCASLNGHYREVDTTPPTRASWEVSLLGRKGYAGIEAYELPDRSTEVQFFDGYYPECPGQNYPPIGEAFEELCRVLVEEVRIVSDKLRATSGAVKAALPPSLPKDKKRAREVWKIAKRLEQEYLQDFKRGYRDDPAPSDTELVDAVNEQTKGKKFKNARRIRDFARWGDAGLLG